jgi:ketosteroid isomerase-like protein
VSQEQLDRVSAYLDAYAHDDQRALGEYFDDGIVWHVAGAHPLSGDYEGSQAVIDYLAKAKQLSGGTLTLEPTEVLATSEHVAK